MKKMIINYSKFGQFFSDFETEKAINLMIASPLLDEVSVSTEMALDCFRLAVKEGRLKPYETYINYTDENDILHKIEIDSQGNYGYKDGKTPIGFDCLRSNILFKLLN